MEKFCAKCGKKLNDNAKFCDNCGQELNNINLKNGINKIDIQNFKKPKSKKGCLITILLILFIPIGLAIFMGTFLAPDYAKAPKDISLIMQATKLNKDNSTEINDILKKCDIDAKKIEHDESLDNAFGQNEKGYRITSGDIKNIIMYLRNDNSVYAIRYADKPLYDNNEVVSKLSDFTLTLDEETNLQINSEKVIKDALKSPSTADFPNITEWKFYKDKEKIIIQSYVDSQNVFGAKLRGDFQITLAPDQKTITSLIIDGKEYLNK
ncbi:MAG: hypothetical protein K0R54_2129 [Clostridiaceae bacterium]|jgi:uncharacterized membrane protein YvbJ|nr:hypothetical protein [Clostridiaceae bacterium]